MDIVIAECPSCGQQYFACDEKGARDKYAQHKCPARLTKEELDELINEILKVK